MNEITQEIHNKKIIRVFPRKTKASPDDNLSFFGSPCLFVPEVDEIHISVVFTYDLKKVELLEKEWKKIAPVKIGGPALNDKGNEFVSGKYLKKGYVITSRGCPNKCWFCDVNEREGDTRELPIIDGWNLLDSNILACSDNHIKKVFKMLKRQNDRTEFTGGLEAKILKDWHISLLWDLKPKQIFFAYDEPNDLEPLIEAGKKLRYADFTRSHLRCYVLIGFKNDTFNKAKKRLIQAWTAGFLPMAMLWKNKKGDEDPAWAKFQRLWDRPAITKSIIKKDYEHNLTNTQ